MQPNWWYNFVGLVIARFFPQKIVHQREKTSTSSCILINFAHWSWLCFHLFPHTWCYSNHTRAYHIPYLGVECLSVWQEPAFMVMQPFSDFPSVPEFARLIKSTWLSWGLSPSMSLLIMNGCCFVRSETDDTPQLFLLVTWRTDDYITYCT